MQTDLLEKARAHRDSNTHEVYDFETFKSQLEAKGGFYKVPWGLDRAEEEKIKEENFDKKYYFDSLVREYTKIYPISGGLASTSHIQKLFKEGEILVTDGAENIRKAFEEIKNKTKPYKFLDLLNCPGGCIGGPAINRQDLSTEERKKIIFEYTHRSSEETMGKHQGKVKDAEDIDLSTTF